MLPGSRWQAQLKPEAVYHNFEHNLCSIASHRQQYPGFGIVFGAPEGHVVPNRVLLGHSVLS
jgi:hypothetical protein